MSPVRKPSASGLRTAAVNPAKDVLRETPVPEVPEGPALQAIIQNTAGRPHRGKVEKTRFTLDLEAPHHRFLKGYATEIEASASEVVRALLDELRDDPELAERVKVRVWGSAT